MIPMPERRAFPRPTRDTAHVLAWIAATPRISQDDNNSVTPPWYDGGNNESKEES